MFKRKQEKPSASEGVEQPQNGDAASLRDELGLYHLWYFELRLSQELARASRSNGVFSIATWHLRLLPNEVPGPELLSKAASIIAESLRSYDIVARIDEYRFGALLYDAKYEEAATVAHRLKGDIQIKVPSAGKWRAGIATFGRDGVDGDTLIQTSLRRLNEDAGGPVAPGAPELSAAA